MELNNGFRSIYIRNSSNRYTFISWNERYWCTMITYDVLQRIEGDTEKYSNYELVQYEFPFPEYSVLAERDKEMNRILNKPIIITNK